MQGLENSNAQGLMSHRCETESLKRNRPARKENSGEALHRQRKKLCGMTVECELTSQYEVEETSRDWSRFDK